MRRVAVPFLIIGFTLHVAAIAWAINLTNGDDVYSGGPGADEVHALQGQDEVSGEEGNDKLYGDPGADLLKAGGGSNEIHGGVGNDELRGTSTSSDNVLEGDSDDDLIDARNANIDAIDGGGGYDTCKVDSVSERAAATRCEDFVVG